MPGPNEIKLARENYPPNDGSKQKSPSEKKEPKKVVKPVAKAHVKKRGFLSRTKSDIFKTDIKSAISYAFRDIFIPASKELVFNMFIGGMEMSLWGEGRGRRRKDRSDRGQVRYERMFDDEPRRRESRRSEYFAYEDIMFDTRGEAEMVLSHLVDLIEDYGQATVHDLYDLVGEDAEYPDDKYGWTNLRNAYIDRGRGGFYINFPKARAID